MWVVLLLSVCRFSRRVVFVWFGGGLGVVFECLFGFLGGFSRLCEDVGVGVCWLK